jgi:flavin reductase (DIM6/NTAB) family NADH-FMN oxidoreductase RutF
MMSTILPRPIAWISTIDAQGRTNLAPYAYFMGVCCVPMTVLFCPVVPPPPLRKKDTLRNIEAVPEFVVNVASASCIDAVNLSAAPLPPGESEFDLTGATPVPSSRVRPPRVQEAAVAFECRVRDIIEVSAAPGGGWVVLGTVLAAHVDDALLDPATYQVDLQALSPVGRLGGGTFVNAASDTFTLTRYKTLADLVRRT